MIISGMIIKSIDSRSFVYNLDCTNYDDIYWPYFDEWKSKSSSNVTLHSGILYIGNSFKELFNYYNWLTNEKNGKVVIILFQQGNEELILQENIVFLGFDCVYLVDEYGDIILVSTLLHDFSNGKNIPIELKDSFGMLNKYGLFNEITDAKTYLDVRRRLMETSNHIENAWKELEPSVLKIYSII